eukprot:scaffold2981_cov62-Cylindrotheca_fusiformis.AAC.1
MQTCETRPKANREPTILPRSNGLFSRPRILDNEEEEIGKRRKLGTISEQTKLIGRTMTLTWWIQL